MNNELPKIKSCKEMKLFIRQSAEDLNYDNRLAILKLLKAHINNDLIITGSDGVRINLDDLEEKTIKQLYSLTEYKLKEESS